MPDIAAPPHDIRNIAIIAHVGKLSKQATKREGRVCFGCPRIRSPASVVVVWPWV